MRGNIIESVNVVVDPVRYKQVSSYQTAPMLPLGVFEDEVENSEEIEGDILPCEMQSTPSTCGVKEGEIMRSMPSTSQEKGHMAVL